ncbi:MAG: hypothetical protein LCH41_09730 [Armatimonadetes bacterium]|nr:hypothetical protein [Armatimonadota bacterium]
MLPLAVLVLGLSGCDSGAGKWVGVWEGNDEAAVSDELAKENPVIANTLRKVSVTICSNGNFVLTRGGMPYEGAATLSRDKVLLQVKTILGRPIENEPTMVQKANPNIEMIRKGSGAEFKDPADFGKPPIRMTRTKDAPPSRTGGC